jgi:hypothetical protein
VSTNNNSLFAVAPAIDPATGNLTYTPAANAVGTATVSVQLQDSEGTSAVQTFTITISPATPTLSISGPSTVSEGTTYTLALSAVDPNTISNWTINWGDGDVQTVSGNPSSVDHV